MAVARHAVNRSNPQPGYKAVIFGAGPIGLGAAIGYKSLGVEHVVVVDIVPARLQRALTVGADAIINSAEENVQARLFELHGTATDGVGQPRSGTDIYLDAAGVPAVIDTVMTCAKRRATPCIPAVHKKPVLVDFGKILSTELNLMMSMGYPTEIFEVTDDIVANRDKYGAIISHRFDFTDALEALKLANTPGAAEKVVITFKCTTAGRGLTSRPLPWLDASVIADILQEALTLLLAIRHRLIDCDSHGKIPPTRGMDISIRATHPGKAYVRRAQSLMRKVVPTFHGKRPRLMACASCFPCRLSGLGSQKER